MRVPYPHSLLFLSILIIHACTQPSKQQVADTRDSIGISKTGFKSISRDFADPTINEPFIDSLPSWITKVYNKDTTWKLKDGHIINEIHEKVDRFVVVNDSITYCIVEVYTYTCGSKFLATHLNRKEIDRIEVEEECDADLSHGHYYWTNFKMLTQKKFRTCKYHKYAADSLLKDGWIKEDNKELDDLDPKTDSSIVVYTIDHGGRIVKMK